MSSCYDAGPGFRKQRYRGRGQKAKVHSLGCLGSGYWNQKVELRQSFRSSSLWQANCELDIEGWYRGRNRNCQLKWSNEMVKSSLSFEIVQMPEIVWKLYLWVEIGNRDRARMLLGAIRLINVVPVSFPRGRRSACWFRPWRRREFDS